MLWVGGRAGSILLPVSVIEIQSTFYDPPAPKVAARWRALAPPDFEFCLKAWQLITHPCSSPTYRRLRRVLSPERRQLCGFFQDTAEVWEAWKRTLEIAETVRASVILFQCPASFKATPANIENLSRFFQKIGPQSFRLAWEPRGPWPSEVVRELCAEHKLSHCVDPFAGRSLYGDVVYWRLHGKGSYSYHYTEEDLAHLKRRLYQAQTDGPAYILFNNVAMKTDAERFRRLLGCHH
jgi:uncharacterized protein YecE (DUF72 family)